MKLFIIYILLIMFVSCEQHNTVEKTEKDFIKKSSMVINDTLQDIVINNLVMEDTEIIGLSDIINKAVDERVGKMMDEYYYYFLKRIGEEGFLIKAEDGIYFSFVIKGKVTYIETNSRIEIKQSYYVDE